MPIFVEVKKCHKCNIDVPEPTRRYRIPKGFWQCKFCVKYFCEKCCKDEKGELIVNLSKRYCDYCKDIER